MDTMAAIRETFFQECEEQLGELEIGLVAMDEGDANSETVNAVFRAVHSIKGGAGAFKLDRLVRFAHTFETALDLIRSEQLAPSPAVMKTLLRSADVLADLVKAARVDEPIDESRTESLIEELKGLASDARAEAGHDNAKDEAEPFDFQPVMLSFDDEPEVVEPAAQRYTIAFAPRPDLYRKGNEALRLLRELARLGEITTACDTRSLPRLEDLDPQGAYLSWRIELSTTEDLPAIEELFEFVVDDCELEIVASQPGASSEAWQPSQLPGIDIEAQAPSAPLAARPVERRDNAAGEGRVHKDAAPAPAALTAQEGEKARSEHGKAEAAAPTIRVDLERVDRLINLVGELVINQAMLSQRVMEAGLARSSSVAAGLGALEQLTREIQEGVMAIRAQPVKPLFQRMSRIVRELTDATGKSVRLRTEGEATEVDRTVIERLADPLTHMIRNAVDHGVEAPAVREAAGKPSQGEVKLSAAHRSGRIVIEVSDDGAGIDRQRVRAIAVKKELIPADAQLSDADIDNLLFLPGFSTATSVSNISGRGVGMDVVKRSIQALGGRISISSRPGFGSTFSMSLPLTLAVLDGMVVKVADQTLVVPLTAIVETLRPKRSDVHALGVNARVISDRGGFAPLIDVGQELGYRKTPADPFGGVVLVVETEVSTRCALVVDAIHDQRQVVIKSLEANYRQVPGIAAATILGDGRVALILDIDTFVARTNRAAPASETLLAATG
ncbi:MAG: chemotaxis protein CheA [Roseiarcus sp.]|jgi:two-component system chemotaxis sensor kinase CheA